MAGPPPSPSPPPPKGACIFLGPVLDRRDALCPGKWIRACDLHGHCTVNDPDYPLPRCTACPDHLPVNA